MPKTRKVQKKQKVLKVDAKSKIPMFEKNLKVGTINFVLVYADWCGACRKFMDNIWNPMCKGPAKHNRMAVRDDMIKNTSLGNAKFDYLPSLLVVDEKGQLQSFETPEGEHTNAMPTPKNLSDMKKAVNVPVVNITNSLNAKPIRMESSQTRALPSMEMLNIPDPKNTKTLQNNTPSGAVYIPTPMVAPQKGGRLPNGFMRKFGLAFTRRLRRLKN